MNIKTWYNMITIKIKTPKDYWEQLKEWVKEPRQEQCKNIVEWYKTLIERKIWEREYMYYLSIEDKDKVIKDLYDAFDKCTTEIDGFIKECYPKYNLPK